METSQYVRSCECRLAGPPIVMHRGIDDRYGVGTCGVCNKKYVELWRSSVEKYEKKKKRSVKFSGPSTWREENGQFQAREGR